MVLADRGHQPGPAHPVAHRTADLRQAQIDPCLAQLGVQGGQHVGRRHVEVGGRADVEDDGSRPVRSSSDQGHDLVLRDIGIDEGQRDVGPNHEEPGDRRGCRVAIRIGEDRRVAGHAAEHGQVRSAGAVQDGHQRQGDRDGHAGQGGGEDDATEGADGQQEVGPLPGPVASQLGEVDQAHDRGDDDRGQDRERQVGEDRGKDDRRGEDQDRGDERGQLGPVAGRLASGGLAQAGVDREPTEQAGRGVRRAEGDELLVRVDLVAVADREGTRGPDRFGEREEDDPERPGQQEHDVANADRRQARQRDAGGDLADDVDALLGQVEQARQDDPHGERDQGTRDARRDAPEGEDADQRADPERGRVGD